MRYVKALFVAVLAVVMLGLTPKPAPVSAQGQMPVCADKTTLGTILASLVQGPFVDAFSKIESAATADDFANLIDLGIQAQHAVMDLPVNPADQGCFYFQLASMALVNDEINVATYYSFIKTGLKNADAYQKGLADAQTRLKKDLATFQAMAQASAGTAPTKAP
jgi:hypothetical protein